MRTALILLVASVPAFGGEVILKNGSRLEGKVIETETTVTIEFEFGAMTIPRSEVVEVRAKESALEQLEAMTARLGPRDAAGRWRAAQFAQEIGLGQSARRLLEETIACDPDHEGARTALGYRRHEGQWLTETEYRQALGQVWFRGQWLLEEEVAQILAREAEEAEARALEAKHEADLDALRARVAEAEAEAKRARDEAGQLRIELEQLRDQQAEHPVLLCRICAKPRRCACPPAVTPPAPRTRAK